MNTGHDGSMSTIHANTARDALTRMENMVQMGHLGLPSLSIRTQIVSAVHLIVQIERQRDGGRRVVQVVEVCGMEAEMVLLNEVFHFNVDAEGADGKLVGHYTTSGSRPGFYTRLQYFGLERDWAAATQGERP
jgi:pilus assembly protein CpaF